MESEIKFCWCGCGRPWGSCHCDCGGIAPISKTTYPKYGYVKDQPRRFLKGHHFRVPQVRAKVIETRRRNGSMLGNKNAAHPRLPEGVPALNELFASYKRGAHKRGRVWELSLDQFVRLTQEPCHYCGALPSHKQVTGRSAFVYNGIDRKDNQQGYTLSNCVPCCGFCNHTKRDTNYEDFLAWITRVASHLGLGGLAHAA